MMQRRMSLSSLCVVLLISSTTLADDWAQWRGPNRDGLSSETGLLKVWPQSGPPLAWKATGLGAGFSSVSISGSRIFTMGDKDGKAYAHAVNLADGKNLWTTEIGKAGAPGWGNFEGTRSTPTVDGNLVFVLGQYGELACLNAADGAKIWQKHLTDDFGGKRPEWGFSESVLVDADKVLCTPGGNQGAIVALNKRTGDVIWQTKDFTDEAHYSSLVIAEIGGVRQYIQLTAESVVGVATDGRVLWRADRKGKTAVIPTPIISGNRVYVTSGYNVGSNMFEVEQVNDQFKVNQVYAKKAIANQHGGALRVGDYVYGYCDEEKAWVCQDLATGDIKWSGSGSVGKGALTYADGHLYLRGEDKEQVALVEATPDGYREKSAFTQPDSGRPKTWPHPVVAGKKLYLRDQDILLCYDVAAQ